MTVISSERKEVHIGQGLKTALIGERINPTGKKKLAAALQAGDMRYVAGEAVRQVEAGATMLDVNAGVPGIDEARVLAEAVMAVSGAVDVPLCIDSSSPEALRAALAVYRGKALVNSVTGEERSLEEVLPLIREYGAAVVGLTMDERGIPGDVDGRLTIARRIVAAAEAHGIKRDDVVIDCLAMTVGADTVAGKTTLAAIRRVSEELGVSTVLGASNISYGLPDRVSINSMFLGMAIAAGLTAAIVDPLVPEMVRSAVIGDLLIGRDEYAQAYIAYYRAAQEKPAEGVIR